MDFSKKALLEYLDKAIEKGRVNKNTGAGMRAACRRILEQVGLEDDVRKVDVSAEIVRYNNRHPNDLAGESLRVYESRVKAAIAGFVGTLTDPTGYKPPTKASNGKAAKGSARRPAERPAKSSGSAASEVAPVAEHTAMPGVARVVATDTSLALPFPLRPNFLAQVVVPRDLTKDEAKRLAAFLDSLATEKR
ncbi:MAG: hypothetical protein KIT60_12080 [Burkholderiaceae bacterium]|nr:hypothetical protein [Burkholderiaceae bacterium]